MKVLYIAYSCSPTYGSEDAIGWNIPLEFAKRGNESFVITKFEHKNDIDIWLSKNNYLRERLHFYYVKIPQMIKMVAKGPLYSIRLFYFIKQCRRLVETIASDNQINTIHQITPVEFRTIVDLRNNSSLNYVIGPIAGAQTVSKHLWKYLDNRLIEKIREFINNTVLFSPLYRKKVKRVNTIFFANKETRYAFEKNNLFIDQCPIIPEVGIEKTQTYVPPQNEIFTFALIGRLISIKGFEIVLDALGLMRNNNFKIIICGDGPLASKLQAKVKRMGLSNIVEFKGFIPYSEIENIYNKTNVLIMPSLREATGTVSIEAMLNGVPVITFNQFGASEIVNNENGWLVDLSKDYLRNIAKVMDEAIDNPQIVEKKGINSIHSVQKYEWSKKIDMYSIYYI